MQEQLNERLLTFIDKFLAGIDGTVDFMSEQLPDYIEQLLVWYAVYGAVMTLFGIILISVSTYIVVKYSGVGEKVDESKSSRYDNHRPTWTHDNDGDLMGSIVIVCVGYLMILWVGFYHINLDWLQIMIAPKVWLVEYASQLAK